MLPRSAAGEGRDARTFAQSRRTGVRDGNVGRARTPRHRDGDGPRRACQASAGRRAQDEGDEQGEKTGKEHPRPAHRDGAVLSRFTRAGQRRDLHQQVAPASHLEMQRIQYWWFL